MELRSNWTDFHEILYLSISRKSVEEIQVLLNSGKNNGYFTWRRMYIYDISLNSYQNEKYFRQNLWRNQNTYCAFNILFFFQKSCRLWGNVEKHGGARQATDNTTMRRLRFDCQINKARTQTLKIPITLLLEHCKNDCTIVPQYYLIIHHFFCFLFTGYITCLVFCLLDTSLVLFSVYWIHHLSCFLFTGTARPAVGTNQPLVGGHAREKKSSRNKEIEWTVLDWIHLTQDKGNSWLATEQRALKRLYCKKLALNICPG